MRLVVAVVLVVVFLRSVVVMSLGFWQNGGIWSRLCYYIMVDCKSMSFLFKKCAGVIFT